MVKILYAVAGFALGIITAPLFVLLWPFVSAYILYNVCADDERADEFLGE